MIYGVEQTITYIAWDTAANAGKTGDVANHTLRWVKNGTSAAPTNSPSEVDSTNAPGVYKLTLTATEWQTLQGTLAGASSTADVVIIPQQFTTIRSPNAAPGGSGGMATVNADNYVGGVQGTINTLDALDTAQDAQHSSTQSAISGLNDLSQAQANAACDSSLSGAGVTSTRMGYVDNLNVGGNVASQADVQGITQAQRVRVLPPPQMERPDSGSTTYRLWLYAYDEQHQAEDLDSNPSISIENNAGTDRSANLGSVTKPGGTTGQYYVDYTVADDHAIESLVVKASCTEGGTTTVFAAPTHVVDTTAVDFTSADRTKLEAIHTKLPSASYLLGGSEADGSGYSTLGASDVRDAVGLASANLDTQLSALNGYVDCLPATLDGATFTNLPAVTTDAASREASKADVSDLPTNAELEARTLVAAQYATASGQEAIQGDGFDSGTNSLVEIFDALTQIDTDVGSMDGVVDNVWGVVNDWVDGARLDAILDATRAAAEAVQTLLNALSEEDGGEQRFTAKAVELAGGEAGCTAEEVWSHDERTLTDSTSGTGSYRETVTCQVGGAPVDGVEVKVYTEAALTNLAAGPLYTDAFGQVTFQLDAGTYYLTRQKAGYNFTNPQTLSVPSGS